MVDLLGSKDGGGGGGELRQTLRSRLLSVLEGSNDLLSGLSSRLESALSLGSDDADSDAASRAPTESLLGAGAAPDGDAAHGSTILSRKLRLPQFGPGLPFEDYAAMARKRQQRQQADEASGGAGGGSGGGGGGASSSDSEPISRGGELRATGPDPYEKLKYFTEAPSSGSASDGDGYGPSTSIDSDHDGKKYWIRSGSEGSVQSWASSLSYESQSDEILAESVEFMRKFVADLFRDSSSISLEQKSKFGQLAQHECGRLWFARFVNAQRVLNKRVDESTFYSLVQYFAIVLFECADADDFSPAKSLMNMCFTFYYEVDVPGCEPYKEYLYTYLKDQPIWHSLRFWNAAFFDALQCERVHRPVVTRDEIHHNSLEAITDERQYQENITFGQLGTFTCNMHAFGLSKELCYEFLRKQCIIANLREDQEKMLRDNIERMYKETDPWR
ncbi:uncharacterized protein KIAA0513 [Schistocerca piceifrons]|uniref:uncharacterized protein KIAA0513 n=1 Tax=Schistocerca piceifrons TaxID=274613 RepID=UPI001F5EC5DA|nr:uncharacterized protein KIAA0513 [Schistocerca piceifrons]